MQDHTKQYRTILDHTSPYRAIRVHMFIKGRLQLKGMYHKKLSSIKGCLHLLEKLSSIKSRLPSKVIFHQRLSCRVSCCPVWSCLVPYISVWCPMASYGPVLFRIALHSFIWPFRTKCVSLGYLCLPLLCFGNEAARDRYVGWSVGQSVSFNTNFKKVPKIIYAP